MVVASGHILDYCRCAQFNVHWSAVDKGSLLRIAWTFLLLRLPNGISGPERSGRLAKENKNSLIWLVTTDPICEKGGTSLLTVLVAYLTT